MQVPDFDIPCVSCKYNLRGIVPGMNAHCPECGHPYLVSLSGAIASLSETDAETAQAIYWDVVSQKAKAIGYPFDALVYVRDSVHYKSRGAHLHENAEWVCVACLEFAEDFEGDNAARSLKDIGIHTSEDIGRILYALIDLGFLRAGPTDSQDDFNGLGTVDEWFADGPDD